MFNFARDSNARTNFRIDHELRHNPNVGYIFRGRAGGRISTSSSSSTAMHLASPSPFVGTFRHSPAGTATTNLGLKGILWEDELKPLMTQVQLSRGINTFADLHISPSILKFMPLFKFNSQSSSSNSPTGSGTDDDAPQCAICLEAFQDGDELRTLACSHLYHRKCIDVWLLGCLSDERTDTNCCPQCRKIAWSPTSSLASFDGCAIPGDSFIRLGQSLSASTILSISQSLEESIVLTEDDMVVLDVDEPQNSTSIGTGTSAGNTQHGPANVPVHEEEEEEEEEEEVAIRVVAERRGRTVIFDADSPSFVPETIDDTTTVDGGVPFTASSTEDAQQRGREQRQQQQQQQQQQQRNIMSRLREAHFDANEVPDSSSRRSVGDEDDEYEGGGGMQQQVVFRSDHHHQSTNSDGDSLCRSDDSDESIEIASLSLDDYSDCGIPLE